MGTQPNRDHYCHWCLRKLGLHTADHLLGLFLHWTTFKHNGENKKLKGPIFLATNLPVDWAVWNAHIVFMANLMCCFRCPCIVVVLLWYAKESLQRLQTTISFFFFLSTNKHCLCLLKLLLCSSLDASAAMTIFFSFGKVKAKLWLFFE